ncbi:response regulator transcription factor [Streptococcus sp. 121]|uniref:response regulator transcription factor n=1 Tax=Streptococcus sp. 121 TaxID=2797637 RepID=UPI0018F06797|nr:response regulator transcription factor [Streptococcus sp. 121]MBJ6745270.1 response regulator transcription factor [Streptococcus sp. 121]
MRKMMVVDDEYMILEGMRHLLPYEDYQIEIVYTAESAEQALAYMEENPVDIVLTDVTMPGLTGLEMIQLMKKTYPQIHVIIMSGYQEFEYARQAVSLGALDYLVKPINKKELARILQTLPETQRESETVASKQFLAGILSPEDLLDVENPRWFVVNPQPLGNYYAREKTIFHRVYYLQLLGEEESSAMYREVVTPSSTLEILVDHFQRFLFYGGLGQGADFDSQFYYQSFEGLIEAGQVLEILQLVPDLKTALEASCPPLYVTKQFVKNIVSDVFHYFRQTHHHRLEAFYEGVESSEKLDQLLEIFIKKIRDLVQTSGYSQHVGEVILLIQEQYAQELSLKEVSARFYLNRVYLGQLIKKETGHSFAELLNQQRIKVAQQLLLHSQASIEEICFQVGYSNVGYFYKIFKRTCGQSPKSYRQSMSQLGTEI